MSIEFFSNEVLDSLVVVSPVLDGRTQITGE